MNMNLEQEVKKRFYSIGLDKKYKDIVYKYLDALKEYDGTEADSVYNHSLRTGLLSYDIAEYLSLDKKSMFLSGLLHDIGKINVDRAILHKKNFSEQDYEKIFPHPTDGYEMLEKDMAFTAQVIVRHHKHQSNPYPAVVPEPRVPFSEKTIALIEKYGLVLSMADFYDSFFRHDKKYFDNFNRFNSGKSGIKKAYFDHRGKAHTLFYELIDMGILSKKYRAMKI